MTSQRSGALRGLTRMGLLLVLATVGCGGGEDSSTAATPELRSTTMSTVPSDSEPMHTKAGIEREVLDAYEGYWQAILTANDPPDQSHPDLRRYATGDAYKSVFDAAQANRLAGRALRLPGNSKTKHEAEVVALEENEATVRDCAVDDVLVVDSRTHEIVNDEVVTQLRTATLTQVDESWRVSFTRLEQRWQGVAGCALS